MQSINWIDAIVCGIMGLSVLLGIWQGLLSSSAGILALVVAFFAARGAGTILVSPLQSVLDDSPLVPFMSVGGVFLSVFVLFKLMAYLAGAGLRKIRLGGLDSISGAFFGFVRGGFFAMAFVLLLSLASVHRSVAWAQSQTVPMLGVALKGLKPLMGEYGNWLYFDKQYRPRFAQVISAQDARKSRSADKSQTQKTLFKAVKKISPIDLSGLEEKLPRRQDTYEQVMEELRNFVAVPSAHTADADTVYHGEADTQSEMEQRLLCMLRNQENCEAIGADLISQEDAQQLEQLKQQLVCKLSDKNDC